MAETNDGGPAFPRPASTNSEFSALDSGQRPVPETDGMSLRDWFAGQALAGIVAGTQAERMKPSGPEEAAHWAYMIADAMLATRTKGQ